MPIAELLAEHELASTRQAAADAAADERLRRARAALVALRDGPVGAEALGAARDEVRQLARALASDQKAVGGALTRLGRAIDSSTARGLSALCAPDVRLRAERVNESVSAHLFREGLFELGRAFSEEANVTVDEGNVRTFKRLDLILKAFRDGDLRPALQWSVENRERMKKSESDLEIRLHRLAYLRLLQGGRVEEALRYAREHFSTYPQHEEAIGKLMTCILFAADLRKSPYAALVSDDHRNDIERALIREYCKAVGKGPESSLVTIVRCGAKAIPNLLKAARVAPNWKELGSEEVLPVEVDVGRECQFHSIFTCPVSREETTGGNNVPMILPCGHVLSKHSISRLPRGPQRFKCPYCPREQIERDCVEVRF